MIKILSASILITPLVVGAAAAQSAEDVIVENQSGSELRGDWVLGARVATPDQEVIGAIEDLILNAEDGNVNAAVISVGGFLGFGSKEIAVDWSELEMDYDANVVTLGITREEAEEAPDYVFRTRERLPGPQDDPGTTEPDTGTDTGAGTGMGTDSGTGSGTGAGLNGNTNNQ